MRPNTKGLNQVFPPVKHMLFDTNYSPPLCSQQLQLSYKDLISEFFPAPETRRHKEDQEPKLLGAVVYTVPCFALSPLPVLSVRQKNCFKSQSSIGLTNSLLLAKYLYLSLLNIHYVSDTQPCKIDPGKARRISRAPALLVVC